MAIEAEWCELPTDILFLIVSNQVLSIADVRQISRVCKSWKTNFQVYKWFDQLHVDENIGKTPFPWLMLSEHSATAKCEEKRGFYNPATREVSEIYLPEAKERRCVGSDYGWIITIGEDLEINLLNPLTRELLSLPSVLSFKQDQFLGTCLKMDFKRFMSRKTLVNTFILKAKLTRSLSIKGSAVMAILGAAFSYTLLAYHEIGNTTWTIIPPPHFRKRLSNIRDILCYEGRMFIINSSGEIYVLDIHDIPNHDKWKIIAPQLLETCYRLFEITVHYAYFSYYLALVNCEFVVVVRGKRSAYLCSSATKKFVVFKLQQGQWFRMENIGDSCFFVGNNGTTFLSPVPSGYQSNSIYFTDDRRLHLHCCESCFYDPLLGKDMSIFSMENGEINPFYDGVSLSENSPPLRVILNFSKSNKENIRL